MAQRHNTYLGIAAALGCCLSIVSFNARAANWPQYRGANRDGISTEVSPEKAKVNWGANGPKTLWTVPTSNGFSSFAVSGGKVFTQVNRDLNGEPREILLALDAGTGKELWIADVGLGKYDDGGQWGAPGNMGGNGPRSHADCQRRQGTCLRSVPGPLLLRRGNGAETLDQGFDEGSRRPPN